MEVINANKVLISETECGWSLGRPRCWHHCVL